MNTLTIYDPTQDDSIGAFRGAGRVVSILKENFGKDARFVSNLNKVDEKDTLFIPTWQPFTPPLLNKRIAHRQILMLFDAIPLKYPEHFPVGLKGRWRLFNNLRSLDIYDSIITISEAAREDIIDNMFLPPEKVKVAYITTSKMFFNSRTKATTRTQLQNKYNLPSGPFVLYVADTNWNKNLVNTAHALIKTKLPSIFLGKPFSLINELREKDNGARQDYFGTSPFINHPEQRTFKEFVKLTVLDESFIFPGYISDDDLIGLYRHAACNILLSHDEGFGLSYLEASTQKTPSVLSDINVFHEIANETALFADPEDPADIAKKIKKLTTDSKLRTSLGSKAYKRSDYFSPSKFRNYLLKAIEAE